MASNHTSSSSSDDQDLEEDEMQTSIADEMGSSSAITPDDVEPVNDTSIQTVTHTPKKRKKQDRRGTSHPTFFSNVPVRNVFFVFLRVHRMKITMFYII